ncbi:hypothetical protein ABVK25_000540 [Lepraria finkii]|uniref:Heme haloperoxidase family profile domain-containing protein n=1 Tax=Lepraria finkii TaxID=1340010 RepID=A0ABR4BN74_9LECA
MKRQAKRQIAFDPATQYVSTTGVHVFVARNFLAGNQSDPCPGLNALANRRYRPHSGVADLLTITEAVNTVYSMGLDLGGVIAIYGTVFDSNILPLTPGYSIGGPTISQSILGLGGFLSTPTGLSGSHNIYEADTSPTRGDLYTLNPCTLQIQQFQQYYDALPDNMAAPEQYEAFLSFGQAPFNNSIETNPYFFYLSSQASWSRPPDTLSLLQ